MGVICTSTTLPFRRPDVRPRDVPPFDVSEDPGGDTWDVVDHDVSQRFPTPAGRRYPVPPMFGPLNGPRTALVAGYLLAAATAAVLDQWIVSALFAVGIAAHGWLWWWMYRRHRSTD